MHITTETVAAEREWVRDRADIVVTLANDVRSSLSDAFGVEVRDITEEEYREAVDQVFDDGSRAVNVATIVAMLRDLDVDGDYPGFVIDEYLGRELAGMIAGEQPLRLLAESTFHYADVHSHAGQTAGVDDLDAALAAGFQTRLPGWSWTESDPFGPV